MKKIITLFVVLVGSLSAIAQNKPLSLSEVIQVEGKNQAQIYGGLREWVATTFVSGKAVTQMEDAASGTIILKANFPFKKGGIYSSYSGNVEYMVKLQSKDGRYRIEMTQFIHSVNKGNYSRSNLGLITTADEYGKGGLEKGSNNKIWKELKQKAAEEFAVITSSLKQWNSFNTYAEEDW